MSGKASIENGKLGGRPAGRKNNKTVEREAARQAYQQLTDAVWRAYTQWNRLHKNQKFEFSQAQIDSLPEVMQRFRSGCVRVSSRCSRIPIQE